MLTQVRSCCQTA